MRAAACRLRVMTARRRIAEIAGLAALCAGVALAGAMLFASVDLARAQDGGGVGGQAEGDVGGQVTLLYEMMGRGNS